MPDAGAAGSALRLGPLPTSRARLAVAIALGLLAWLALRPTLGARYMDGHDAWIYPTRVTLFETALGEGQWPPVWAAALASGHGQPHFEFVPPLLYVAAMPFRLAGASLTRSILLPLAILHTLGLIAVYRIARRRSGRLASTATAAAWLFAPYLATDLYVRAAFAESAGLATAPIGLLFYLRLLDRPTATRIVWASLTAALVMLSHIAIALLFLGSIAFLGLLRSGSARIGGFAVIGWALALSAFFWLPAMLERPYAKVDRLRETPQGRTVERAAREKLAALALEPQRKQGDEPGAERKERKLKNHRRHAVAPFQLLWSPWNYGKSMTGTERDGMSFELGWLHVLLGALGALAAWRDGDRERGCERLAFFALAVGGAWISTDSSMLLWDLVQPLQYLAFPWRSLFLPALFLPLVMSGVFERIGPRAVLAAIAALALWNLPHLEPWRTVVLDEAAYSRDAVELRGVRASAVEEYAPRWAFMGTPRWPDRLRAASPLSVEEVRRTGVLEVYRVTAAAAGAVQAAPFFYPGWRVRIDGEDVPVRPAARSGVLEFDLPAGSHEVVLEFGSTPTRWIALVLSVVTIVMGGAFLLVPARFRA